MITPIDDRRSPQMAGHGEKASRRLDEFVTAVLMQSTLQKAAEQAWISSRTARRWIKMPAFQDKFREARSELMKLSAGQIQAAAGLAIACLVRSVRSGNSESAQVAAARTLLDFGFRVSDNDILERVLALERRLDEEQEKKSCAA